MNDFERRAALILHHMALERTGSWRRLICRWHINDEPLRNDAANLLREYRIGMLRPEGTQYVGDDALTRIENNGDQ